MTVLVRSKAGIDPTGSHWPAHGEMAQIPNATGPAQRMTGPMESRSGVEDWLRASSTTGPLQATTRARWSRLLTLGTPRPVAGSPGRVPVATRADAIGVGPSRIGGDSGSGTDPTLQPRYGCASSSTATAGRSPPPPGLPYGQSRRLAARRRLERLPRAGTSARPPSFARRHGRRPRECGRLHRRMLGGQSFALNSGRRSRAGNR
jgi:hypothetical protein